MTYVFLLALWISTALLTNFMLGLYYGSKMRKGKINYKPATNITVVFVAKRKGDFLAMSGSSIGLTGDIRSAEWCKSMDEASDLSRRYLSSITDTRELVENNLDFEAHRVTRKQGKLATIYDRLFMWPYRMALKITKAKPSILID